MRVLIIGAGGVGSAMVATAKKWNLFERVAVADYDEGRAKRAIVGGGDRFAAFQLDGSDEAAIVRLIESERVDAIVNALDPRFVMPLFRAAFTAGVTYLDMAMSLSHPHPSEPYRLPGVKLGDEQFAMQDQWKERGRGGRSSPPATPRTRSSRPLTRSACVTAPTWWSRATSSPRPSRSGRR